MQIMWQKNSQFLESLLKVKQTLSKEEEVIALLMEQAYVCEFAVQHVLVADFLAQSTLTEKRLALELIALSQGAVLLASLEANTSHELMEVLKCLDTFYADIGGIIGYHDQVLKLIDAADKKVLKDECVAYRKPSGVDVTEDSCEVRAAIRHAIENLDLVAEIYPVGGAGDRLNLCDAKTKEPLPAAQLPFLGRSLLAGLIRDVQAKEYLCFKLTGKKVSVPIVMMTSYEKHNDAHIHAICEENKWFGRSPDKFYIFTQPQVPVLTEDGDWMLAGPGRVMLKPGGHGVIWKLALEKGVFDWLEKQGCTKALVRQINNPMAGLDYGLLALAGMGVKKNKAFGFASCLRYLNISEGMDILIERKVVDGYEYGITNVEYTEFAKRGIEDRPEVDGSPYSLFPANTNLLFVDLQTVRQISPQLTIPGKLINMKTTYPLIDAYGNLKRVHAGRLESTMQNIADIIVDKFPERLHPEAHEALSTFITYNERKKTISVTKKTYSPGSSFFETPEGCHLELLANYHDLLTNYCGFELPQLVDEEGYRVKGPSFIVNLHPALGPLYSVIGQKLKRCVLKEKAELQLDIAEVDMEDTVIDGSLVVEATFPLGTASAYGTCLGRFEMRNVKVINQGIDRLSTNHYWKNQIHRCEAFVIKLHGHSEFSAEGVTLEGGQTFEVMDGYRLSVRPDASGIPCYQMEKLTHPSWYWSYAFDPNDRITLQKIKM